MLKIVKIGSEACAKALEALVIGLSKRSHQTQIFPYWIRKEDYTFFFHQVPKSFLTG
jgi:hypothetical protein